MYAIYMHHNISTSPYTMCRAGISSFLLILVHYSYGAIMCFKEAYSLVRLVVFLLKGVKHSGFLCHRALYTYSGALWKLGLTSHTVAYPLEKN